MQKESTSKEKLESSSSTQCYDNVFEKVVQFIYIFILLLMLVLMFLLITYDWLTLWSRFDSHSFFASKINKDISYPEMLNLRPFMSKNQVEYWYIGIVISSIDKHC